MNTATRRQFLQSTAAAAIAAPFLNPESGQSAQAAPAGAKNELCVFTKPLQHLGYDELADLVAKMGFAGIEGTVRSGGHVEPEQVTKHLPKQMAALKKRGLAMTMMTTDVNQVESKLHRQVLQTAADLGVQRFRMGAIKFDADKGLPEQLDGIRVTFEKLVAFCEPLGLQPLYQNHAGAGRLGAGIWDLYEVLKGFTPEQAGTAFDIRHATVEGGQSWPTEFQLMRPWFGAVYCKDFVWKDDSNKPENVPLGSGRVDYKAFFKLLKKSQYSGPISLHMEYKDHKDPALLQESITAIRSDLKVLQGFLA